MGKLEGLDEEITEASAETEEKITSFEDAKKKRKPFHFWEVGSVSHKLKLTTGMIVKLENKYRTNIMNLVTADGIPTLSVMLTIIQAAMSPWEHGINFNKVQGIYTKWEEDGGSQMDLYKDVIMPTMAVSGFFTETQAISIMESVKEMDDLI